MTENSQNPNIPKNPIRVLYVEDYPLDAELTVYQLEEAGFNLEYDLVAAKDDFIEHLKSREYDIILTDYKLQGWNGFDALQIKNKLGVDTPIVLVTGTIGDEYAVECIKEGISDYVLKGNPARLRLAVERVLKEKAVEDERRRLENSVRESEKQFRMIFQSAMDVILIIDNKTGLILESNPAAREVLGYEKEKLHGEHVSELFPKTLPQSREEILKNLRVYNAVFESREFLRADGSICIMDLTATMIQWKEGKAVLATFRDVSERVRMEKLLREERASLARRVRERTAELSLANAELFRAARLKNEFLANMSHELRTPLNSILGRSETLLEGLLGQQNEKQLNALRGIYESGGHLLDLINDILDLSKIEAGKLELDTDDDARVSEICRSSLNIIKQIAFKKHLKITKHTDSAVKTLKCDIRRLKQILVNLLSNAVKFTPEGGTVGLEVIGARDRSTVMFTVHDTGTGIAKDDLDLLFQPFVQVDAGLSREQEGTGLGLAMVMRLAEMHGGGVSVESEKGKGSRFTVSLPWNPVEEKLLIARTETKPPAKAAPAPIREHSGYILLAEDNEVNIETLSGYLTALGYQIVVARNGAEAVERVIEQRPEIILMDIQMPKMNGFEAIRLIREFENQQSKRNGFYSAIPVIALTALAMQGDREKCLAAGADEYVCKPVSLKELVETIERLKC